VVWGPILGGGEGKSNTQTRGGEKRTQKLVPEKGKIGLKKKIFAMWQGARGGGGDGCGKGGEKKKGFGREQKARHQLYLL